MTDNLNELARITDNKIRYIDLKVEYPSLPDNEFIKKLHNIGLSKEDLQEIGVNETFLKQNENKLLPRSVIEKYKEFKYELDKHNKIKK